MKKRLRLLLLTLVLLLGVLTVQAFAATTVGSGTCGDDLTWTLDSEGTLTISGTGDMYDYFYDAPWYENAESVKKLVIGDGMTGIGRNAFLGCINLTKAVIPQSIRYIGDSAFYNCPSLTGIDLPEGLLRIDNAAFFLCYALTEITIPESVTAISDYAFYECIGLTEIHIPKNVVTLGVDAFSRCGLEKITVAADNTMFCCDASGVLYTRDKSQLILVPVSLKGSYTIPASVTTVASYAFNDCIGLTKITIPQTVTAIGEGAFEHCSALTSLTLPTKLTYLSNYLLSGCSSLTEITIPAEVSSIGVSAFSGCTGLTKIVIPEGVTELHSTFWGCKNLEIVTLPSTLTTIGHSAFRECVSLAELAIPASVTSFGSEAFYDCTGLTGITIPAGVTEIPAYLFAGCTALTKVILPDSVTTIGLAAFSRCNALTELHIPDSVTDIGSFAFEGCFALSAVALPEGLTRISERTFYACGITGITVPKSVDVIDAYAFENCEQLDCIIFDGNAPVIDETAFTNVTAAAYYPVGNETWSNTVQSSYGGNIIWKASAAILQQSKTTYTQLGATAKATVKADGVGLKYQWYIKNAGATKYSKSSVTSATYSVKMTDKVKDRLVYCVITDKYGNSIRTETVRLRMAATVTSQPVHTCASDGEKLTVKLTAVGDGLTYKWYFKDAGASKFTSTPSFTGNSYSIVMNDARDGRQVYCVVTDKYGKTHKSDVVTLGKPLQIITAPKTTYAQYGKSAKVTVKAEGIGLTYEWYIKNANGTSYSKSSLTGSTYSCTMDEARNGRYLICYVTDLFGNRVKCSTVRLRMAASITAQPKSVTVAEGAQAKVTVTAVGDGLTYKWYFKDVGASSFKLTTAFTGSSYYIAMNEARDGRQVYCVVTDKYGKTVNSNVVTLSMK